MLCDLETVAASCELPQCEHERRFSPRLLENMTFAKSRRKPNVQVR